MAVDKVLACIWSVAIAGKSLDMSRKRCVNSLLLLIQRVMEVM